MLNVNGNLILEPSKVVDENGEPLVVYHGTDAKFTVFDRTKTRANMDIQGMFFSPWELDAQGYGQNVKAFFLNIKNPATESDGIKALNKFKGQNNAGVKAREYLVDLGYDGVNNESEEFIAFNPNQIKSATNNNGEFSRNSNDVRYSVSVKVPTDIVNEWINYFKDYSPEGKTDNDIFLDIKRMALLNSQAYKGYKTEDIDERNNSIYETKDRVLVDIIKHILDGNSRIEVLYDNGVVYFEYNGIQYSFHGLNKKDPSGVEDNATLIDRIVNNQKRTPIWSGKKIHQEIDDVYTALEDKESVLKRQLNSQIRSLWERNNPYIYKKKIRDLVGLQYSGIDFSSLESVLKDTYLVPISIENDIVYNEYLNSYNNAKTKKTKDKYLELMSKRENKINSYNEQNKEKRKKVTELFEQMQAAPQNERDLNSLEEFAHLNDEIKKAHREFEIFKQGALNLMIEDFNSNSLLTSKGESMLSNTIYDISDIYNVNMEDGKNHEIPVALTEDYVCFVLPQKHASQEIQNEYKNSANKDVVDYVRLVTENKHNLQNIPNAIQISRNVSQRLIDAIQHVLNIDVADFKIQISTDEIIHIINRHGERGSANASMREYEDYGRIGYVINNLDSLIKIYNKQTGKIVLSNKWKNKDGTKTPELLARKQVNGHFMVANVVVDSARKQIQIISAYKNKEIPVQEANTLKSALVIRSTTNPNNGISYMGIKPNFGTDVNTPRYSITAILKA